MSWDISARLLYFVSPYGLAKEYPTILRRVNPERVSFFNFYTGVCFDWEEAFVAFKTFCKRIKCKSSVKFIDIFEHIDSDYTFW